MTNEPISYKLGAAISHFRSFSKKHPLLSFVSLAIGIGLLLIFWNDRRLEQSRVDADRIAREKAEIELVMNRQAAHLNANQDQTTDRLPKTSQSVQSEDSTDDAIARNLATNISKRVSESPNQILRICDDVVQHNNRLPGLKNMNLASCLLLCNQMLAQSDEESDPKQKFRKDRNGKYSFRDAARAVQEVGLAASKL